MRLGVTDWVREWLTTIGQARMAVLRQTFSETLAWVIERIKADRWNSENIKIQVALP